MDSILDFLVIVLILDYDVAIWIDEYNQLIGHCPGFSNKRISCYKYIVFLYMCVLARFSSRYNIIICGA